MPSSPMPSPAPISPRPLGRSGINVSPIGMGCWAIGGPQSRNGQPVGWSGVDDESSIAALQRAFDLGCTYFDTADIYGSGHSERLIAAALGHLRDQITIGSKVGYTFDEATTEALATDASPDYIRRACEASLKRLDTDRIDLYMFHLGNHDLQESESVLRTLEDLVTSGKIRSLGWSTDDPTRAALFAQSPHCAAIQQAYNLLGGNAQTLELCTRKGLACLVRNPLEKGLLTGKFTTQSEVPQGDIRSTRWNLKQGPQAQQLQKIEALRPLLTTGGRTMTQGALSWLLAKSPNMVPIPGFKNKKQVEENLQAMHLGPLTPETMTQINQLL